MSTDADSRTAAGQADRLLRVNEQVAARLHRPAGADPLRAEPGETEWSALQVVGHLAEMIPYWLQQCQALIAASEPPRFGRSLDAPERLAGVKRGTRLDADALLRLLDEAVQQAAATIRQMSPAERGKTGLHPRMGEISVADAIETLIVAHAEDHLAQIEAALAR